MNYKIKIRTKREGKCIQKLLEVFSFEKYPERAQKWRDRILNSFLRSSYSSIRIIETNILLIYLLFSKENCFMIFPGRSLKKISKEEHAQILEILKKEVEHS